MVFLWLGYCFATSAPPHIPSPRHPMATTARAPRDGAVGHALRDDHDPHRQPGHQVCPKLLAGHLWQPLQHGDLE